MKSSNVVVKRSLRGSAKDLLAVAALVALMILPSASFAKEKEDKKETKKTSKKELCQFVKSEEGWLPEKLEGLDGDEAAMAIGEAFLNLKNDKPANMSHFLQAYRAKKAGQKAKLLEMGQVFMFTYADGIKGKKEKDVEKIKKEITESLGKATETDFGFHGVKEGEEWTSESSQDGITSLLNSIMDLNPEALVKMSSKQRTDFVKKQLRNSAEELGLGKGEDCSVDKKSDEQPEPTPAKDDEKPTKDEEPTASPTPAVPTDKTPTPPPTTAVPPVKGPEQPFVCNPPPPSNSNIGELMKALTEANNLRNPLDALGQQLAARTGQQDNKEAAAAPAAAAPAQVPPQQTANENPFSTPLARDGKADPVTPAFPPLAEVEQANPALAAFEKPKNTGEDQVAAAKAAIDTGKRIDQEIATKSRDASLNPSNLLMYAGNPQLQQAEAFRLNGALETMAARAESEAKYLDEKSKKIGTDIAFLKKASKKLKDVSPNEDFAAMETRLNKQVQDLKKYQEQVGGSAQETAQAAQDGGASINRFMSAISQKVTEAQEQLKVASLLKSLGKKGVTNAQEEIEENLSTLEASKGEADATASNLRSQAESLKNQTNQVKQIAMSVGQQPQGQSGLNGAKLLPAGGRSQRPVSGFGAAQGSATSLMNGQQGGVVRGGLGPTSNMK